MYISGSLGCWWELSTHQDRSSVPHKAPRRLTQVWGWGLSQECELPFPRCWMHRRISTIFWSDGLVVWWEMVICTFDDYRQIYDTTMSYSFVMHLGNAQGGVGCGRHEEHQWKQAHMRSGIVTRCCYRKICWESDSWGELIYNTIRTLDEWVKRRWSDFMYSNFLVQWVCITSIVSYRTLHVLGPNHRSRAIFFPTNGACMYP